MDDLSKKVQDNFFGMIVRKDLTTYMKRTANVPGFVIEYLLGMYCNSSDENDINLGLNKISKALGENYVKAYEIELIKSKIKEKGYHTIIDCLTVKLDEGNDVYIGTFSNFKIGRIVVEPELVKMYPKLLVGGVWGFIKIVYNNYEDSEEEDADDDFDYESYDDLDEERKEALKSVEDYRNKYKKELTVKNKRRQNRRNRFYFNDFAFILDKFSPIQLASFDLHDFIKKRKEFTLDEWIVFVLRSVGIESTNMNFKERLHYIERLVPLFERNYNLVELGPRGTGKSYIYKEISPYSILLSGGNANISSLFYNLVRREVGLVGNWDCVAFDEITGKTLSNELLVQILKDFMASGSFTRGTAFISADASLVFLGNINDSVENLLKIGHLFSGFALAVENDSAFFDRMHYYLPGWEVGKMNNSILTSEYGLISDCFAEFAKEMRKYDYGHDIDKYFKLNKSINTRDEIAIRKTMSGLLKVLFPDKNYNEHDMKTLINYAIEGRVRVRVQLKKMVGSEFADINLGYIDKYGIETIVQVPEKAQDSFISSSKLIPGQIYTAGVSFETDTPSLFRIETKSGPGYGKFITQGISVTNSKRIQESVNAVWTLFKKNYNKYSNKALDEYDYMFYLNDLQNSGGSKDINVAIYVSLVSTIINKSIKKHYGVLGSVSITGTFTVTDSIINDARCLYNAGAKTILLPFISKEKIEKEKEPFLEMVELKYYENLDEVIEFSIEGDNDD